MVEIMERKTIFSVMALLALLVLNESLAELKRAELVFENVFSLSENKIMKIYDIRAEIKSALYKALSLDSD
jgi:hypothetical protein